MRVLLINPPWDRLRGVNPDASFPLGLGYLASILRNDDVDVMIYNGEDVDPAVIKQSRVANLMQAHDVYLSALKDDSHPVWIEVGKLLTEYSPDIIGIYTMTPMIGSALKIAQIFKKLNAAGKVVLGGPHPSLLPDEVLQYDVIDFAIRGEGEQTLSMLCKAINKGDVKFSDISGLSFKVDGVIKHNNARNLIKDLDIIPFPSKDLLFFPDRVRKRFLGAVIASRGCPYRCSFCSVRKIWGKGVRYRSPENVYKEIEAIVKKFNQYDFVFWDDSLTVNKKKLLELCDLLKKAPFDIKWACSTRVDLVDEEILTRMKEAGCGEIGIGIESGSERMLKKINKDITIPSALKASDLLTKMHFSWAAFYMIGFPGETIEDMRATFDLMKKMTPSNIIFSIFAPFPGNDFYDEMKNSGILPDHIDWNIFYKHSPDNYFSKTVPRDEFVTMVKEISGYVDKYNNSFMTQFKRVRYRLPLILKSGNRYLLRSFLNFIKRKLGLG
jgi:anaerobic magnesium-protoporphyrin IX monomethyl ester cyclase